MLRIRNDPSDPEHKQKYTFRIRIRIRIPFNPATNKVVWNNYIYFTNLIFATWPYVQKFRIRKTDLYGTQKREREREIGIRIRILKYKTRLSKIKHDNRWEQWTYPRGALKVVVDKMAVTLNVGQGLPHHTLLMQETLSPEFRLGFSTKIFSTCADNINNIYI